MTHEYVFDYRGRHLLVHGRCRLGHRHSYIVYGPLANGATTLMFEGVPNHPGCRAFWAVSTSIRSTILYRPTAIAR